MCKNLLADYNQNANQTFVMGKDSKDQSTTKEILKEFVGKFGPDADDLLAKGGSKALTDLHRARLEDMYHRSAMTDDLSQVRMGKEVSRVLNSNVDVKEYLMQQEEAFSKNDVIGGYSSFIEYRNAFLKQLLHHRSDLSELDNVLVLSDPKSVIDSEFHRFYDKETNMLKPYDEIRHSVIKNHIERSMSFIEKLQHHSGPTLQGPVPTLSDAEEADLKNRYESANKQLQELYEDQSSFIKSLDTSDLRQCAEIMTQSKTRTLYQTIAKSKKANVVFNLFKHSLDVKPSSDETALFNSFKDPEASLKGVELIRQLHSLGFQSRSAIHDMIGSVDKLLADKSLLLAMPELQPVITDQILYQAETKYWSSSSNNVSKLMDQHLNFLSKLKNDKPTQLAEAAPLLNIEGSGLDSENARKASESYELARDAYMFDAYRPLTGQGQMQSPYWSNNTVRKRIRQNLVRQMIGENPSQFKEMLDSKFKDNPNERQNYLAYFVRPSLVHTPWIKVNTPWIKEIK